MVLVIKGGLTLGEQYLNMCLSFVILEGAGHGTLFCSSLGKPDVELFHIVFFKFELIVSNHTLETSPL